MRHLSDLEVTDERLVLLERLGHVAVQVLQVVEIGQQPDVVGTHIGQHSGGLGVRVHIVAGHGVLVNWLNNANNLARPEAIGGDLQIGGVRPRVVALLAALEESGGEMDLAAVHLAGKLNGGVQLAAKELLRSGHTGGAEAQLVVGLVEGQIHQADHHASLLDGGHHGARLALRIGDLHGPESALVGQPDPLRDRCRSLREQKVQIRRKLECHFTGFAYASPNLRLRSRLVNNWGAIANTRFLYYIWGAVLRNRLLSGKRLLL